jgi:hypothetical protein
MVAAVSRWAVAAAVIVLCGCHAQFDKQLLSERYNVCAKLPSGSTYRDHNQWIDFDTGILEVGGVAIDVEIGGHPRFSQRVKRTGEEAIEGFRFLGKERSDDRDKILLGYERRDGRGPMFVMFSAPDLQAVERTLTRKNLVVDCK